MFLDKLFKRKPKQTPDEASAAPEAEAVTKEADTPESSGGEASADTPVDLPEARPVPVEPTRTRRVESKPSDSDEWGNIDDMIAEAGLELPPDKDISVYDGDDPFAEDEPDGGEGIPAADTQEEAPAEKKAAKPKQSLKERIMALSILQMGLVAGAALVVILLLGLGSIFIARWVIARRGEATDKQRQVEYTEIEQPTSAANNANFIFIGDERTLNGQDLTLRKLSAGLTGTWFYFDEVFEPEQYDIWLYDQTDTLFHLYGQDGSGQNRTGTSLRFGALGPETLSIRLIMQDKGTAESVSFDYRFKDGVAVATPVYVNGPLPVSEEAEGLYVRIEEAVFSNTGTDITYSLQWAEGAGDIRFAGDGNARLMLQDGISQMPPLTQPSPGYRYDGYNTVIGRVSFAAIRSLQSTVTLNFSNMFFVYRVPPLDVDIRLLFDRSQDSSQTFTVGEYNLILEGMGVKGNKVILVLHGEDDMGQRTETRVEVDLTIKTPQGPVVIKGECLSNEVGSDVVFDLSPYREQGVFSASLSSYTLDFSTVQYHVPHSAISFNLTEQGGRVDTQKREAARAVQDAFKTRLAYKANQVTLDQITGFASDVRTNPVLMQSYTPVVVPEGDTPKYAAQVVVGTLLENGTYLAVVEEEWTVGEGKGLILYRATHQVVAENRNGSWLVISDILL